MSGDNTSTSGATVDKRDERTSWRPSYMRKSGSKGDASKSKASVNPTQDVKEPQQARNDRPTRDRTSIAHVLLPPQILPKAKEKVVTKEDGWSAW